MRGWAMVGKVREDGYIYFDVDVEADDVIEFIRVAELMLARGASRSFRFVYRRKCCKHSAPEPVRATRDPVGGHNAGCPSFDALPKPCTCKAGE